MSRQRPRRLSAPQLGRSNGHNYTGALADALVQESQKRRERDEPGQEDEYEESSLSTPEGSMEVSSEEEWIEPMDIEIKIRNAMNGDLIVSKVHSISKNMRVDPTLGSIHNDAQALRRRTEQGRYVENHKVYAQLKFHKDERGVPIRCDKRPYDKVRDYLSENTLVGESDEPRFGSDPVPWHCIEAEAIQVSQHDP